MVFGQSFKPTLVNFYAIGQLFVVSNGQILKTNLAIWSLCWGLKCESIKDDVIISPLHSTSPSPSNPSLHLQTKWAGRLQHSAFETHLKQKLLCQQPASKTVLEFCFARDRCSVLGQTFNALSPIPDVFVNKEECFFHYTNDSTFTFIDK